MAEEQSITHELFQRAVGYRGSGRLEEAEALCLQMMEQTPSHVPARHLLALINRDRGDVENALDLFGEVISLEETRPEYYKDLADTLMSRGKVAEAAEQYRNALGLRPEYFEVHANLGNLLLNTDRVDEALDHYREATRLRPDVAALHDNLGNALRISGNPSSAVSCHEQALRLEPGLTYAHVNLGIALTELGRYDEAVEHLNRALEAAPNIAQAHFSLATAMSAQGRMNEALGHYQQTISLDKTQPEFHKGLADAYASLGKPGQAIDAYQKSLELDPDYFEAHVNLGNVLKEARQVETAITHYQEALRIRPDTAPDAEFALGNARMDQERFGAALAHYREARRLRPDDYAAVCGEFNALRKLGDMQGARECIEPFSDVRGKSVPIALAFSHLAKNDEERRVSVDELKQLQSQSVANKKDLRTLHFRLGDILDALNAYDAAFEQYKEGNELRPQEFRRTQYREYIDRLISEFSQDRVQALPSSSNNSELPVFVVGMPRAGKTLVEHILASHPQVTGAGEITDIEDFVARIKQHTGQPFPMCMQQISAAQLNDMSEEYLAKRKKEAFPGSTRVVDTMPDNIHFLGFIRMLFPRAHIIHCLRDPLDTCLECYFKNIREHSYSRYLDDVGFRYQHYWRLSQHWRDLPALSPLEVRYEELVGNPEKVSREIVDYLGLDWDAQCLDFHVPGNARLAGAFEILEPINTRSIGRWKNYMQHIQSLVESLGSTARPEIPDGI